jgi:hypothetical protein
MLREAAFRGALPVAKRNSSVIHLGQPASGNLPSPPTSGLTQKPTSATPVNASFRRNSRQPQERRGGSETALCSARPPAASFSRRRFDGQEPLQRGLDNQIDRFTGFCGARQEVDFEAPSLADGSRPASRPACAWPGASLTAQLRSPVRSRYWSPLALLTKARLPTPCSKRRTSCIHSQCCRERARTLSNACPHPQRREPQLDSSLAPRATLRNGCRNKAIRLSWSCRRR